MGLWTNAARLCLDSGKVNPNTEMSSSPVEIVSVKGSKSFPEAFPGTSFCTLEDFSESRTFVRSSGALVMVVIEAREPVRCRRTDTADGTPTGLDRVYLSCRVVDHTDPDNFSVDDSGLTCFGDEFVSGMGDVGLGDLLVVRGIEVAFREEKWQIVARSQAKSKIFVLRSEEEEDEKTPPKKPRKRLKNKETEEDENSQTSRSSSGSSKVTMSRNSSSGSSSNVTVPEDSQRRPKKRLAGSVRV